MRIEHLPFGEPCLKCGEPIAKHRVRPNRDPYFREYNYSHTRNRSSLSIANRKEANKRYQRKHKKVHIIGIDGEGFDSGSVYGYLAAWSEKREKGFVENLKGLRTHEVLDFLLSLRHDSVKVGFSLGYDYTHWLRDLDNATLYLLNHPEDRLGTKGTPVGVPWVHKGKIYLLNILSGRFSVNLIQAGKHKPGCAEPACPGCKAIRKTNVWDFFKFFQTSFVKACKEWGVINEEEMTFLLKMKGGRSGFQRPTSRNDTDWLEIKRYCGLECRRMAQLARKVIEAHSAAGLMLRSYYGAGSTGGAMLDKMKAREFCKLRENDRYIPIDYPKELSYALACAFFGGRFEISRRGPVRKKVWSKDISSAYPYAFTFLPCLVHGEWEWKPHAKLYEIERADMAVVRYSLPWVKAIGKVIEDSCERSWGPFPFRDAEGNIIFPATSGGGWVHKEEYLAGLSAFPNVKSHGAWIYRTDCSCEVFRKKMPEYYKLRLSWGKEGKGLVVKGGIDSCYGKTAQTKGFSPPFQCVPWAGAITASCRSQVIPMLGDHCHMVATDGVCLTKDVGSPLPRIQEHSIAKSLLVDGRRTNTRGSF